VEEARQAIEKMNAAVTGAAENAKRAAQDLSAKFRSAYWSLLIGLTLTAVLAGVLMGVLFVREFDPPQENIIERVIVPVESIPAVKPGKR
jgi:nitrogen fixation/metabolism regulation signal transduction histidine kinase